MSAMIKRIRSLSAAAVESSARLVDTRLKTQDRGASFIECILALPLIFGLIYGLLQSGATVWQSQRSAFVSQESGRLEFERCFRGASRRSGQDLLNCFDQTQPQVGVPWSGILPLKTHLPHGTAVSLGLPASSAPTRVVVAVCHGWVATDADSGLACTSSSRDCHRSCGQSSGESTSHIPDLNSIEVRDSADLSLVPGDDVKRAIWQRFGAHMERRGFVLISEVASALPEQGIGTEQDLFLSSVF